MQCASRDVENARHRRADSSTQLTLVDRQVEIVPNTLFHRPNTIGPMHRSFRSDIKNIT